MSRIPNAGGKGTVLFTSETILLTRLVQKRTPKKFCFKIGLKKEQRVIWMRQSNILRNEDTHSC